MCVKQKMVAKFATVILTFVFLNTACSSTNNNNTSANQIENISPVTTNYEEQGLYGRAVFDENRIEVMDYSPSQLYYGTWEITYIYPYLHPQTLEMSTLKEKYLNRRITFLCDTIILDNITITVENECDTIYQMCVIPNVQKWFLYEYGQPNFKSPTNEELGLTNDSIIMLFKLNPDYLEELYQNTSFNLSLFYIKDKNTLIGTADGYYYVELKRISDYIEWDESLPHF